MNVLHVNNTDLPGRRFNGYDLLSGLRSRGISGKQAVLSKLSENADVISLMSDPGDPELQERIIAVEERHSMDNLLTPWGRLLVQTREFMEADVVHYHLIHNRVISLLDLPHLMGLKPSVWTFHDPWPLTGHCIYPMDCRGWQSGCEVCAFPSRQFAMQNDCADRMWRIKRRVYSEIDVDVVVASAFMLEMVRESPLATEFERIHLIPFGVDAAAYLPEEAKTQSRRRLGIPEGDFVIFFRAAASPLKGVPHIIDALNAAPPQRSTTIVTVDQRGLLRDLRHHYNIVDLGWLENQSLYSHLFSASDVFLMPSTAEAFGLMAIEAMAAGRPVICFEGTSLPSVTHAPECGIAVPCGDSLALRSAIDRLAADNLEVARRGELGRSIVEEHYGIESYLDAMAKLYRSVSARGAKA